MKKKRNEVTEPFLFKRFVQSPNAVINPGKADSQPAWADQWGRTCGNPVYHKKYIELKKPKE